MYKTGVYALEQIDAILRSGSIHADDKNFAITLYDQILEYPNSEELAERILLLFTDERGAYKRTYSDRFAAFDKELLQILQDGYASSDHIRIHDVGVSDARTSVDLFLQIREQFPNLGFYASDYNPMVYVISHGRLKLIMSDNKKLLQIIYAPFVFNKIKRDSYRKFPINHIVRWLLEIGPARRLMHQYSQGSIKPREYYLFAPKALQLAKQEPRFILRQHDILKPFNEQYDMLRAMNVLNLSYFTAAEFGKVITNLYEGLTENGILAVGSNQDAGSTVDGAIYKKQHGKFVKVTESGSGAQLEQMILGYRQ